MTKNKMMTKRNKFLYIGGAVMLITGLFVFANQKLNDARAQSELSTTSDSTASNESLKTFNEVIQNLLSLNIVSFNDSVFKRDSFENGYIDFTKEDLPKATNLGRPNPFTPVGNDNFPLPVYSFVNNIPKDLPQATELEVPTQTSEDILTLEATTVTEKSAVISGSFTTNLSVSKKWFEYGTSAELLDKKTPEVTHTITRGFHRATLADLSANTTYYYRVVVLTKTGETIKGMPLTFTTLDISQN